jgi:hypothetical protein
VSRKHVKGDTGFFAGMWQYFAPAGWATQWYWEGSHGKVWNFFHGKGWRVG